MALCIPAGQAAHHAPSKWLIVSAPREGKLSYKRILPGGRFATTPAQTLVATGLVHPQGLAIDPKTSKLLVADPDSQKIFSFTLRGAGDTLSATQAGIAMRGVEARWVAVDGLGNVYATDEPSNRILKVTAAQLEKGDDTPEVLYDGLALTSVSGPGGIVADNYYAYWVNKQIGTQVGSLVRGDTRPERHNVASSLRSLAKNTDKSYGLCAALGNIYYTQPDNTVFVVKKTGSGVQLVTDKLSKPRGCAWDGDGTVFVADRGANAVFSFPGNMDKLGTALVEKAVEVEDAFGVAVFNRCPKCASIGIVALLLCGLQLLLF